MNKIFKREFMKDIWIMLISFTVMFFYTVVYRIFDITNAESEVIRLTSYGTLFFPIFVIAMLFAVYLFSFKNSREKLDLLHSLPISRNKYFLIQYIKGLIYFSVIYFVCIITALIIDLIYYPELTKVTIYFVLFILKYWLITVLFYSFFVLSSTVCAMSIYSIFFGLYLMLFPVITSELVSTYSYTNYPYFNSNFKDLGTLIGIFFTNDFSSNAVYYSISSYLYTIIILVLINLLLVYASTTLYKKFKTENTASPIGFDKLKAPLIIASTFSVTTFVVLILLRTRENNLVFTYGASLIILPIVALLAEFLVHEGFRNIKPKKAIRDILISFAIVFSYYVFINSSIHINTLSNLNTDDILVSTLFIDGEKLICIDDDDIEASVQMLNDLQNALPPSTLERMRYQYQTSSYFYDSTDKRYGFSFRYTLENNRYIRYDFALTEEEYEQIKPYINTDFGMDAKTFSNVVPDFIDYFDYASVTYYNKLKYRDEDFKYYFNSYQYYYPFKSDNNINGQSFKSSLLLDIENTSNSAPSTFVELPILFVSLQKNGSWFESFSLPIDINYVNTLDILKNTTKDFNLKFEVYDITDDYLNNYVSSIEAHTYYTLGYSDNTVYTTETKDSYISGKRSILNFNSTDVINGNVNVKVYTGDITPETIRANNLKIIFRNNSSFYYFGTIE